MTAQEDVLITKNQKQENAILATLITPALRILTAIPL
jgi:hypothetical protein